MNLRSYFPIIVASIIIAIYSTANALTIMPMGDSITVGIDFQTNAQGGYRDPLQTGLNAVGISFNFMGVATNKTTPALTAAGNQFHNGYSGYRIDQLTANLDANGGQSANLGGFWITGGGGTGRSAQLPDLVLLHIGGNDVNGSYDPQTPSPTDAQFAADMGQRLTTLLTNFHALSPNTVFLVASIIPVNTSANKLTRTQLYNTYVQNTVVPSLPYTRFVNQYGTFVNADGSLKSGYLGTDNLHPTMTGYQAMAMTWRAGIQAYLNEGGSAPAAPTGLSATAGNTQVSLSWTGSSGATSYNLYRGTTAGGESTTPVATGITATSYTNTGLTNGATYYYKVKAVNSSGASAYSNEASATPTAPAGVPAAPTGLSATAGNTQVNLTWTASSGATSYEVYRGTTSNGQNATPIATGITATSYTNTGLTNGTTYYYKVKAVNSSGSSGYSNEASALPTAGGASATFANASFETPSLATYSYNPAGSSWTFTNNAGIQHNGSAYSGAVAAPDGVQTAFVQSFNSTLGTMSQSVNFAAGSYTISFQAARRSGNIQPIRVSVDGTAVGTYTPGGNTFALITTASFSVSSGNHTIAFAATDNVGDKTSFIDLVSISGGGGGGQAPAAPTGLGATAGNAQITLNWTASSGATSYQVYRGTASNGESTTALASGITATSYTDAGLTNGTTYYYKVKAVNASGTSGYSNEASATPSSGSSATFTNPSFEAPSLGSYSYNPTGSSWTFTNNAGIQHNGSAYSGTGSVAPDGVQTAFVQSINSTLGTMSQGVNFSAGTYTISFQAARRSGSIQPIRVSVDGVTVGTYTPASNAYALITTASFSVAAGSHTIMFAATDNVGDKTSFIDMVSIGQ